MRNVLKKSLALTVALALGAAEAKAELIALYQFNDSSNLGKDTSGYNNNATNNGAVYTSSGYQNGAASFDGTYSYLRAPVNPNPTVLPSMTWGAWVKPSATNPIRTVLSADNGGFDRDINIDNRGGSTWSVFTGNGVYGSGVNPSSSEWVFLAAVYYEPTNSLTFYVNDKTFSTTTNFNSSFNYFDIGHNPGFGEYFSGSIDNVFVYNEALSSTQIASIQSSGFPVPEPSAAVLTGLGLSIIGFASRTRKRMNS
jgi:hypothetical protein